MDDDCSTAFIDTSVSMAKYTELKNQLLMLTMSKKLELSPKFSDYLDMKNLEQEDTDEAVSKHDNLY
jgi:hypothetical protein